ncbi:MAG TPA: hypothetical protein VHY08_25585 [Bacillota bacterium]|nr:hypothetical protein [Bacillota bacterium]
MMQTKIYQTNYKNIQCLAMESPRLLLRIIPESGSKIQSIFDKKLQKEYLYQSPGEEFIFSKYDSNYGQGDMSGFDEVFPSIETCCYPLEPWRGIRIPDHGEVWALPWSYDLQENSIIMSVHGVRFPYRLTKTIEFLEENIIRINYEARNFSDFDFYFAWAPHTLFGCEEDTVIVLPPSVRQIFSTCSVENKLGKFGSIHSWPVTHIGGETYDIAKVYPKYPGKCEKYYAMGKITEGWCALHHSLTGNAIGLSYPIDQVPYLGIWEGIVNRRYITALEPCTGDLDYLDTAFQWNRVSSIKGKSVYKWYLNLTFDTVEKINQIDAHGFIK